MDYTRSKNKVLGLALGLTIPLIVTGCGTVPPPSATAPVVSTAAPSVRPLPAVQAPVQAQAPVEGLTSVVVETPAVDTNTVDAQTAPSAGGEYTSLWARIRAGFALQKVDDALIAPHEKWFIENAEFREAMFERSKLYLYYIVEEVEKRGMPMEIALLPAIESAYKPYAYSRARASGLWQFIPSTGKLYGLKSNWWYDGRRDVVASTRAALDYLQKLHDDFDGDWHLAIAAYNAGEGRIMRAMEYNRRKGLPTTFVHLRQLKPETKHYVPKLFAMVNLVSDPQKYGIALADIPNAPYFTTVDMGSQIDLGVVARLTGMEADQLHHINPGYTRWATHPEGPHQLLVPVDKKEALLAGLSSLPQTERVKWQHHEVKRGDTFFSIARKYNVTVDAIKAANKIEGGLRIGQSLLLPISASAPASGPGSVRATPVRSAPRAGQMIVHRVRAGDTLWSLARRYNVLVHQIAEWNVMEPGDILKLGQKVKIWTTATGPSARLDHTARTYV